MSSLKAVVILFYISIFISDVNPTSFGMMDFARDTMMPYYSGTEKTVQLKLTKGGGGGGSAGGGGGSAGGGGGSAGGGAAYGDRGVSYEEYPPARPKYGGFYSPKSRYRPKTRPSSRRWKSEFTYVNQTYRARSTPSNKFLEALTAIERGAAEAKAAQTWLSYSDQKLQKMKNTITMAVQKKMFQYSRNRLGEALFLIKKHQSSKPKQSSDNQASTFVNDLKESMGTSEFDEFMAVMGDVTLMFAIDTTGSMSDEINTAKRIAVDVINYPRKNPVNYILSPFNDPTTGPVTFKESTEGADFVEAISKLRVRGGGDCPELTFKGILNALYEGPHWGSPLYVLTDADAKDATPSNIEEVISLANHLGVTINFFTTRECGAYKVPKQYWNAFMQVAEATSGQMLRLKGVSELQQLNGFTGSVLGGSNIICSGTNRPNRQRRGIRRKMRLSSSKYTTFTKYTKNTKYSRYIIKIDDTVEKISVCVTTENADQGEGIALTDPQGVTNTSGKVSMSKVSFYEITAPEVGAWTLKIPASAGSHNYFVKSISDTNIDFEHYFLMAMRNSSAEVPITNPIKGQPNDLVLTVAGVDKIRKNETVLELVTKHGQPIRDIPLTPDARGVRYTATFTPPSHPFKLKLKGTTNKGNSFERISRNIVEPKSLVLRVLHSDEDYTLSSNETSNVTFQLYNAAADETTFNIRVKDSKRYAKCAPSITVGPRDFKNFNVEFKIPSGVEIGTSDTAVVTVSTTSERVTQPVQLIVTG